MRGADPERHMSPSYLRTDEVAALSLLKAHIKKK